MSDNSTDAATTTVVRDVRAVPLERLQEDTSSLDRVVPSAENKKPPVAEFQSSI